jgi:hypothetical protein
MTTIEGTKVWFPHLSPIPRLWYFVDPTPDARHPTPDKAKAFRPYHRASPIVNGQWMMDNGQWTMDNSFTSLNS